LASEQKS
jgi:predicted O-methyltransferase YrrM